MKYSHLFRVFIIATVPLLTSFAALADMDSNEFMGMFMAALATLVGLFTAVATPLIKLNRTNATLSAQLDAVRNDSAALKSQLNSMNDSIEEIKSLIAKENTKLAVDNKRLEEHEARLNRIDKS